MVQSGEVVRSEVSTIEVVVMLILSQPKIRHYSLSSRFSTSLPEKSLSESSEVLSSLEDSEL